MKYVWVGLFLMASACAAETNVGDESVGDENVGSSAEALRIGGFGVASCPGGGSPQCVVCNNGCKSACSGDYTCDTAPGVCSYSPGQCSTSNVSPTFTFRY